MWGASHPPYLMMLSFLNSIAGASVTPIVRSLLLPRIPPTGNTVLNDTKWNTSSPLSDVMYPSLPGNTWMNMSRENYTSQQTYSPGDVKVQYAFLFAGVILISASLGHSVLAISKKCNLKPIFSTKGHNTTTKRDTISSHFSKCKLVLLGITFAIVSGNTGSIEETYAMFLFSFLVKQFNWRKMDAAWPLIALQVSIIISQFSSIGISKLLKPSTILAIMQAVMMISTITMCFSGLLPPAMLWVCTIVSGLAIGPLSSVMISWMSGIFGPSGKLTSFYFTTMYLSRAITSQSLGFLFDKYGPMWFVYMNIITVGASTVAYILIVVILKVNAKKAEGKEKQFQDDPVNHPMINSAQK